MTWSPSDVSSRGGGAVPKFRGVRYNILRIIVVCVFEQHEYLISRHLIWAVLCSLLYDQEGSLKSINLFASLLISGIFNGVRRTKNLCAARACSSY